MSLLGEVIQAFIVVFKIIPSIFKVIFDLGKGIIGGIENLFNRK